MPKRVKEDEQSYYICGQCHTKIFYLKSEEAPTPCPECDVNVTITGTGRNPAVAVGQPNNGVAAAAALTFRSVGWEHKDIDKDDVPNEIKLDLTQY